MLLLRVPVDRFSQCSVGASIAYMSRTLGILLYFPACRKDSASSVVN